MLRPALAPGMATMLAHNLHRDVSAVRLFELGTVFTGSTEEVKEHTGLALGATGDARFRLAAHRKRRAVLRTQRRPRNIARKIQRHNFVRHHRISAIGSLPAAGAALLLNNQPVAVFGELTAAELQQRKLRQPCVIAEVHAATLLATPLRQPIARELSRFQAVERDFSFVFPNSIRWHAIDSALRMHSSIFPNSSASLPSKSSAMPKGKAIAAGQLLTAGPRRLPIERSHAHRRRTHRLDPLRSSLRAHQRSAARSAA